jgi:hypothetical protein
MPGSKHVFLEADFTLLAPLLFLPSLTRPRQPPFYIYLCNTHTNTPIRTSGGLFLQKCDLIIRTLCMLVIFPSSVSHKPFQVDWCTCGQFFHRLPHYVIHMYHNLLGLSPYCSSFCFNLYYLKMI